MKIYPLLAISLFSCTEEPKEAVPAPPLKAEAEHSSPKSSLIPYAQSPPSDWQTTGYVFGIAAIVPDHLNKFNSQGIIIDEESYLFRGNYQKFTAQEIGTRVKVSGVMTEGKQRMFIRKPNSQFNSQTGIPVPPGTDIESKSRYYFFTDPKWEPAPQKK